MFIFIGEEEHDDDNDEALLCSVMARSYIFTKLKKKNKYFNYMLCVDSEKSQLETNITRWNHHYENEKFEFEKHSHIHDSNYTITNNGRLSNERYFLNFHQKHCSLVY
jgi:hypothetical protein